MTSREMLALPLIQQAIAFVKYIRVLTIPTLGELRQQCNKSAVSIVSNLAEGIGKNERGSFFAIARGSAFECAAQLELAGLDAAVEACHTLCDAIDSSTVTEQGGDVVVQ